MTIFAGIISRNGYPTPPSVAKAITRSISRDPNDRVSITDNESSFFAKVDIGAFGEAAEFVDDRGNITLVAGDPLLGDAGRAEATTQIHTALLRGQTSLFERADGVFSVVHFRRDAGELTLVTDKLGIRPIYYHLSPDFVVFASALRILEAIREVPKVMDVRAVTEMVGLGYALADRTPYKGIKLLRPAEVLCIDGSSVSHSEYWRWDDIDNQQHSEAESLRALYTTFDRAVARRNVNDEATAAYLSGGLDSRCIVAALRDRHVAVHTFNFARPGTQDQVLGREFAAAVGADHHEVPKQPGDLVPDYSELMADAWIRAENDAERPHMVWSGEGGSVILGHVHMCEKIVTAMRAGDIDGAIDEHVRREFAQVSGRIFKNACAERLAGVINDGIGEELARLNCIDPARNFYLFLLFNDQHRKLAKHFENIDVHRLEFQLPFFDSTFIETTLSTPVDICLRHELYVKWLALFPDCVRSVPWQAYPGHEPCPAPIPAGLGYQWSREYQTAEHAARKKLVLSQARELMASERFPKALLNKTTLRLAAWAHASGLRDYGYMIGPAHMYYEYAEKCSGLVELL